MNSPRNLCSSGYYLCTGVLSILRDGSRPDEYDEWSGAHSGECGIVADLSDIVVWHQQWFVQHNVDYGDMTDGVYDYDILEGSLASEVVEFYRKSGSLPNREETFSILDNLFNTFQSGESRKGKKINSRELLSPRKSVKRRTVLVE